MGKLSELSAQDKVVEERPMGRKKKKVLEEPPAPPKALDIFEQFNLLFQHEMVEDPPYHLILHRFLASDQDFAYWAREFTRNHIYDPLMLWKLWCSIVPPLPRAPFMRYVAPKAPKAAAGLVPRLMEVHRWSRERAEESAELMLTVVGKDAWKSLAATYGVELQDENSAEDDDDDLPF